MKKLLRRAAILVLSTFAMGLLSGCEDIDGSLTVNSAITLKKHGKKDVALAEGNYRAALKPQSRTEVVLEVQLAKNKKETFRFKLPKGKKIEQNTEIRVPAATSGQPLDASGMTTVEVERSSLTRSVESCTWTEYRTECHWAQTPRVCESVTECNPNDPNQCKTREVCSGGERVHVCEDIPMTRYGHQEVEYYTKYTTKSANIKLLVPGSEKVVASFQGSETDSDIVYTYQGVCH